MILKKRLIIALGFFMIGYLAKSQSVPGYLGKRWAVSYSSIFSPSLSNPHQQDVEFDMASSSPDFQYKVGLNLQHRIQGEWVFSKRSSLIAQVNYSQNYFNPAIVSRYPQVTDTATAIRYEVQYDFPQMQTLGFRVGIQFYGKQYAPLGSYFEIHVGYAHSSFDEAELRYVPSSQDQSNLILTETVEGAGRGTFTAGLAFGSKRVVYDDFFISYGLEFNYALSGFTNTEIFFAEGTDNDQAITFPNDDSEQNQEALAKSASGRYAAQILYNFKFGVGVFL